MDISNRVTHRNMEREMINKDSPAFPKPGFESQGDVLGHLEYPEHGMNLRAYIATACMQGILASWPPGGKWPPGEKLVVDEVARTAVEFSDALIAELNQ